MRFALLALAFTLTTTLLVAADKPAVAELKKQVAEAEKKLADLKAELARAEGEPTEFADIKEITQATVKVGVGGKFAGAGKVAEVVDDSAAVLAVTEGFGSGPLGGPVRMTYKTWRVIARDYPTKGLADGKDVDPRYWHVTGTEKRGGETLFVVRPGEPTRKAELKTDPKPEPPPKPKLEPKPGEVVLTPSADGVIVLGNTKYAAIEGPKRPDLRAKWVSEKKAVVLKEPTIVEVVSRDEKEGTARVKLDGKEWLVDVRFVPAEEK